MRKEPIASQNLKKIDLIETAKTERSEKSKFKRNYIIQIYFSQKIAFFGSRAIDY